jgi:tetratricopeptide (TPR) repeat protein
VLRPSLQIDNEDGVLRATKTYFDWYFDVVAQSGLTLDDICDKGLPINNMRIEIAGYQDPNQIMFDLAGGAYEIMCGFCERGWLRIHKGCAAAKLLIYRPSPFTLMDILSRFTDRMWISRMDLRSRIYSFIVSMAQSLLGREHIWAKVLSKLFSDETTDSTRMSTQRYIIDTLIQSHFNANPNYTTRVTEILGYEVIDELVPEVRLQHFTKDLAVSLGQNHIATRKAKFSLAARFYRAYQHKEAEAILVDALPFCYENATQFMDSTLAVTLTHLGYIYYAQEEYEKCISYARQAVQGWLAINKQSFHLLGSFEQLQRVFIRLERWEDLIKVQQENPDLHEKMPVALHAVEIPRTPSMMANPCNLLPNIEDQDTIGSNDFSRMTHDLASVESAMVYY